EAFVPLMCEGERSQASLQSAKALADQSTGLPERHAGPVAMQLAEPVPHPLPLPVDAVHGPPVDGRRARAQRFVHAVTEADALHEREPVRELQPNFEPPAVSGWITRRGAAHREFVHASALRLAPAAAE